MAAQFRLLLLLPCLVGFYFHGTAAVKCFSCLQGDLVMLKKLEREDWGDQVLWPARGANLTTRCGTVDWPMETCDNGNQCIHMHFTVTAFKRPFDVEIRNCYTDPGDKPLFMFVKNPNFTTWVQFCNATLCNTLTTDELRKDTRGAAGPTSIIMVFVAIFARFLSLS